MDTNKTFQENMLHDELLMQREQQREDFLTTAFSVTLFTVVIIFVFLAGQWYNQATHIISPLPKECFTK